MFPAQMPDPDLATSTNTPLPVQQSIQSLSTIPFEEYIAPGIITSAGEFVPDPSPATRHDTLPTVADAGLLVRTAAEALHFNLELLSLLLRELGGDWSATTISELTTGVSGAEATTEQSPTSVPRIGDRRTGDPNRRPVAGAEAEEAKKDD